MLREGLCLLINLEPDMQVVAEAAFADQAVQCFIQHQPNVALIDLDLPRADGIRAIREIRMIDPTACLFGLFTYESDESSSEALRAGARKCLAKDHLNHHLISSIRESRHRQQ